MPKVVGIDPGATGGIFLLTLDDNKEPISGKMMTCSSSDEDTVRAIMSQIQGKRVDLVVVEQVASFPGQGVSSTFTFGKRYGVILGCLHSMGVRVMLVRSQKWQKDLGLTLPQGTGDDQPTPAKKKAYRRKIMKEGVFNKAKGIFSDCEGKPLGKENSDAAMIALWGAKFAL